MANDTLTKADELRALQEALAVERAIANDFAPSGMLPAHYSDMKQHARLRSYALTRAIAKMAAQMEKPDAQ